MVSTSVSVAGFGLLLLLVGVGHGAAQTTGAVVPPEPTDDADLPTVGAWIERWLPAVGAASYATIEGTGDFLAHASDSVTGAGLDGCTLVLQERSVSTVRAETTERRQTIRVPLAQVDTSVVQPKVRRAGMLLGGPNVMLTGQLVVPLKNQSRTPFITVVRQGEPDRDSLAAEHLVPFPFAVVPATRSARAIRRAAALCIASSERHEERRAFEDDAVFGN